MSFELEEPVARGQHHAVRTIALGVALTFLVFIIANFATRGWDYTLAELTLDASTMVACLSVAVAVGPFDPKTPLRSRELFTVALAVFAVANISFSGLVLSQPSNLLYLPYVPIAAGSVCLTWPSLLLVSGISSIVGVSGAAWLGRPSDLVLLAVSQCIAIVVAGTILTSRRLQGSQIARFRRSERRQLEALATAKERLAEELRVHEATEAERQKLEAEHAELRNRAEISQRLEALGTLAGGVAHDMNNVLLAIGFTAESMLLDGAPSTEEQKDLRRILAAVNQGSSLTRSMLAFAKRSEQKRERTDLHQVIDESVALLRRTLPKGMNVEVDLATEPLPILGDAGQLGNVIINLIVNAADAAGGRGHVQVKLRPVAVEGDELLGSGPHLSMTVTDDGPGMAPETAARAFEPFFSTKDGDHTGLGLSMVFGTVRQHGGDVRIESEPGKGTVVNVLLPVAAAGAEGPTTARRGDLASFEGVRMMVVDDEPLVLHSTARALRALGFDVTPVAGGPASVDAYRKTPFELVLLDVDMPVMNGPDVFEALRSHDPEARVVFASGYPKGADIEALLEAGALGFLRKPFSRGELERALADALGSGDPAGAGSFVAGLESAPPPPSASSQFDR
ncbi:MAG: ATP-binding protein [Myxococcota bacterium]